MSVVNSIERAARDVEPQPEQSGFQLPPGLAKRYEVRIIAGNDEAQRRIGLFLPTDRENPSIEISGSGDRIVARREDPETVGALVQIARHNGWEGIDVDGSPEFRKAVWAAGTREGLTVRGYAPEFGEQAHMDALRCEDATRRERETAAKTPTAEPSAPPVAAAVAVTGIAVTVTPADAERPPGETGAREAGRTELSSDDQRRLLSLSAYTQDRKVLEESFRSDMSPMEREFQQERLNLNRDALHGALDRALESPTLASHFSNAGYEPDDLRKMARAGEWGGEIADAIHLARSGLQRDTLNPEPPAPEAARFTVEHWDVKARANVVIGETNSPSEAVRLFQSQVDTRIVDRHEGRAVASTEWVKDGSFPQWNILPAMTALVEREASDRQTASEVSPPSVNEPRQRVEVQSPAEPVPRDVEERSPGAGRNERDRLAELFLHGGAERISAEPRLAGARDAQAMMERHLGAVFDGDAVQTSAASLESRQMISDVLRRGLDVSVREPTPVRQIEPPQPTPDLER